MPGSVEVLVRASVGSLCAMAGRTARTDLTRTASETSVRMRHSDANRPEGVCHALAAVMASKIALLAKTRPIARRPANAAVHPTPSSVPMGNVYRSTSSAMPLLGAAMVAMNRRTFVADELEDACPNIARYGVEMVGVDQVPSPVLDAMDAAMVQMKSIAQFAVRRFI